MVVQSPDSRDMAVMGTKYMHTPVGPATAATPGNDAADPSSALPLGVHPLTLQFEDVGYIVKSREEGGKWCALSRGKRASSERTILRGVTGIVRPGELLAMLGPSGSGKTTLITALAGRLGGKPSGKITYNGLPFSGSTKRRIGFVTQEEVLYAHLTVTETLVFTALLRLPQSLPQEEKVGRADLVIRELGLDRCRNSLVGGGMVRGISGGEKKRVSIGQEMLLNPSLMLLDEPTSGLDSTTALRILTLVKRLAQQGRTVVATIHQPSTRLYHMFHNVLLLSDGRVLYQGKASAALDYFASVGFAESVTVNPADLMLDLANGLPSNAADCGAMLATDAVGSDDANCKLIRESLALAYEKYIATSLIVELRRSDFDLTVGMTPVVSRGSGNQWSSTWWFQFRVLLNRGLRERRYQAFNNLRVFQVLAVAFLGGLLWWHTPPSHIRDRIALLSFICVFFGFFPLYNAVFAYPQERPILIKERSSGMYRLSAYFFAKTVGDLPMELALPTLFVIIIYWMGGLAPNPVTFALTLFVVLFTVLVAQSLGLAIGAILMDIKQSTTLASVITIVFLAAGGYYIQQIPPFIRWFKYLSYSYYCYQILLAVQFSKHDYHYFANDGRTDYLLADLPLSSNCRFTQLWIDVGIMTTMLVGYRFAAYWGLHRAVTRAN